MKDIVCCNYSFCQHDNKELKKSEAVQVGNQYYHKDCRQTQEDIKEIVDLFVKYINPNPVFTKLQSVIKTIVFRKKMGSDYLLFGLKYYIQHQIPLNYPQGLYYVVQNKDVRQAYDRKKADEVRKHSKVEITEPSEDGFQYRPTKTIGFQDILESR